MSKVHVTLAVDDQGTPVIKRFGVQVDTVFGKIKTRAQAATVSVKRHLDEMGRRFEAANERWGAAAGVAALGVAAVGAALVGLVSSTARAGDQLYEMSLRTGASIEQLSALGYVASVSGINLEAIEKALRHVSRAMVDFEAGGGQARETFEALGLSVTGSTGQMMGAADFLVEIADKFKIMTDETRMAAYASEIFGAKAGPKLLPMLRMGSQGIEDLAQRARELGIIMGTEGAARAEAYSDAVADLSAALTGLKRTIGLELLPVMQKYVDALTRWVVQNRELIAQRVPEHVDDAYIALRRIWALITYSPYIISGGLIGLVLFGPKGAAAGGAIGITLGYVISRVEDLDRALGKIDWGRAAMEDYGPGIEGAVPARERERLPAILEAPGAIFTPPDRMFFDAGMAGERAVEQVRELGAEQKKIVEDALAGIREIARVQEKAAQARRTEIDDAIADARRQAGIQLGYEIKMMRIRGDSAVQQLEFIGKHREALDLQISHQGQLAEQHYQAAIQMAETDADRLAATKIRLEAETQLHTEHAHRRAELWWQNAQAYIGFAQQMAEKAVGFLLAERDARRAIGEQMLQTAISFMARQLQEFLFMMARKRLAQMAFAGGGGLVAALGGAAAFGVAGLAVGAIGALVGGLFGRGRRRREEQRRREEAAALEWQQQELLAQREQVLREQEWQKKERVIREQEKLALRVPAPVIREQEKLALRVPAPVTRIINIHILGHVVDHDTFAREIIPSIVKAVADGVH